MVDDHPEGKGMTCYRDETFEIVTRWHADTKISYRPHAKSPYPEDAASHRDLWYTSSDPNKGIAPKMRCLMDGQELPAALV
jgi:hypothetical protein